MNAGERERPLNCQISMLDHLQVHRAMGPGGVNVKHMTEGGPYDEAGPKVVRFKKDDTAGFVKHMLKHTAWLSDPGSNIFGSSQNEISASFVTG